MTKLAKVRAGAGVVAAAALTISLAACGSSSGSSAGPDLSSPAPTGVTLTMWHPSNDSQALLDLYKAYEKASGNTIQLVDIPSDTYPAAVLTKWASGDRPDLMEWHPNPQDMKGLIVQDNMVDLSSLSFVKAEGALASSSGSVNGVTYGAILGPLGVNGIFYNKKVLAAAGVSVPKNYTELMAACEKIKTSQSGVAPIFESGGSEWPAMSLTGFDAMADFNKDDAWGQSVADGKTKVNDPNGPFVAGLTSYAKLRDAGCFNSDATTAKYEDAVKSVVDGKAAMTALGSDQIDSFYQAANGNKAQVDQNIGLAPISTQKGTGNYALPVAGSFFVPKTKDAQKERAAADFVDWATTKGYQAYVNEAGILPTLSTATAPKLTGLRADVQTVLNAGPATPGFDAAIPGFGNFGQIAVKLMAKQDTPQKAADDFQTFIDQGIAATK